LQYAEIARRFSEVANSFLKANCYYEADNLSTFAVSNSIKKQTHLSEVIKRKNYLSVKIEL